MRIVVTGGFGFIGSHFVNFINKVNPSIKILIVDKLTYASNIDNVKSKDNEVLLKDISKLTLQDLGIYDYLINFAAESHVDNSIDDGRPFVKTNVEGTFNLLELARKNIKLKKFIQISTDEVYGDMLDYGPNIEATTDFNLFGSSYYSSTKAAADLLVQSAGKTFNLPYLITRTCNNYGENQHKEKFIPTIINCIKNDIPIPIYGDGLNIREWIYVDDNCKVIYDLMLSEYEGIMNIGTGERCSNLGIIGILETILDKPVKLDFVEDRKGHDRVYALDSSLTPNILLTTTLHSYFTKIL